MSERNFKREMGIMSDKRKFGPLSVTLGSRCSDALGDAPGNAIVRSVNQCF